MKTTLRILLLLMMISGFCLSSIAHALQFNGQAWLAHHYSGGSPTDEYFLVIDQPGITKAKLKGFKFEPWENERVFSNLTEGSVTFWKIDNERSRKIVRKIKKASREFGKLEKKGKFDENTDQQAWINEYAESKLAKRKYKLKLWDEHGKKMRTKAIFARFENPPPGGGENPGVSPVPEPATMLLLGSGLVGFAAAGRKKIFKKK